MKNKHVVPALIVGMCALCLALTFVLPKTSFGSQEVISHPALTKSLVTESGEKVVEVTEASYRTSQNVLQGGSCRVKNLSGQNITGMGLIWTVTLTDGQTSQVQKLVDFSLHKDIVDTQGVPPFAPYSEREIPHVEREFNAEGQSVKSVKVEVAFVTFADSSGVGIENSKMYQRLLLRREGAEIYKKWLASIYGDDPKNINRVVEKLSGDELPADERVKNDGVESGAAVYRQWLLQIYKKNGADSLKQILKRR